VRYLVTQAAEGADEYIVGYIGPEVADVGVVIHGRAAAVKTDLTGRQGFKALQLPSKGIKEGKLRM